MTIQIDEDDETTVSCSECDGTIAKDTDTYSVVNDEVLCENCTGSCSWCGDEYNRPVCESHYSAGSDLCENCADNSFTCDRCSGLSHMDEYNNVDDDYSYCDSCAMRYCGYCGDCSMYHFEEDRDSYDCDFGGSGSSHLVNNYSYKPSPIFFGTTSDRLFMGLELEVDKASSREDFHAGAEWVQEKFGDLVYMKTDGSLSSYGLEIVTHPMTLDYAQSLDWDMSGLISRGFRSWDSGNCGIHIHVSKNAFTSRTHMYAFALLIMRNRALSEYIAGRKGSSYAQFSPEMRQQIAGLLKGKYKEWQIERYNAVNMKNEHTIEVRIFRGSLKAERILADLEYVHACVKYSQGLKSGSINSEYLSTPALIQWIRANRETYPNLVSYINKSSLFGMSPRPAGFDE